MGKFIDVSEFQSDIDWKKAKDSVDYVYIRAAIRGSLKNTAPQDYKKLREDRKFRQNIKGVQENGIPYSGYFFPTSITYDEAVEEAEYFYNIAKDLEPAFPFALDSENVWGNNKEAGRANDLSKADRTRFLKVIIDYFGERGLKCGIYASAWWLGNKIDMSVFTEEQRKCTWVADSTGEVDYKGEYWLHQYGKGPCTGIKGDVDLNRVCGAIPSARDGGEPSAPVIDPVDLLISVAESEVGYHEKASAASLYDKTANSGDRNYTKYGKEMHLLQPRNMDYPAAWCDAFVDWCFVQAFGAEMARQVLCGDFDDYTFASVNLYKKAGRWSGTPQRGDQIFFGGSGHTGIVYAVDTNYVYTIEGNKSNQVKKSSYRKSDYTIIGYGHPRYDLVSPAFVKPDKSTGDLHTVKWTGYTKVETKVYTQPDTSSPVCSFSPMAAGEQVGVCKRVGKFYMCKYLKIERYGYIHASHIRK